MKRVVCINAKPSKCPHGWGEMKIKEGEIYTVLSEAMGVDINGNETKMCYELDVDPGWGYSKDRFIPCSDISETEFIREYKKETV